MKTTNTFSAQTVKTKLKAGLGLVADTSAKMLEASAKADAPWQDRTGAARNTIQGDWAWKGDHLIITVSGNEDYSASLELGYEKRYAVLVPTIQRHAPSIIKAYRRF